MVLALPENEGSTSGRKKTSHPFLSQALGKSLRAMVGEHSGLVHQPPGLVGTSDSSVVPESENCRGGCVGREPKESSRHGCHYRRNLRRYRAAEGSAELATGRRHTRYLVFILDVGLRDDGREDAEEILSDERARDRAGHYFLLGRADDYRRPRVQTRQVPEDRRQHSVP